MESNGSTVNKKMEPNVFIGARLRSERERLGINQEDLASIGGVTRQTQSKYEKGERNPDSLYLSAVAEVGIDVRYVLTDFSASFNLSQDKKSALETDSSDKSAGYGNLKPGDELETPGSSSGGELEPDERQWLQWYRQIKPEDRELVEPVVRGFADRGKGSR